MFDLGIDPGGQIRAVAEKSATEVADLGAKWVRLNFNQYHAKGDIDSLISLYRARNIQIIGLIGAESSQNFSDGIGFDSGNSDAFTNTLIQAADNIVSKYGDRIKVFEIFNEPNYSDPPVPPEIFAKYLAGVYRRVKIDQKRTDITIISGGLLSSDAKQNDNTASLYLKETYAAGRRLEGNLNWELIKKESGSYPLDGVGYHIYAPEDTYTTDEKVRSTIESYINSFKAAIDSVDRGKNIWITEFGWRSQKGETINTFTDLSKNQARNLKVSIDVFKKYPSIKAALWYTLRDPYVYGNDRSHSDAESFGLLESNTGPLKLSARVFKNIIAGKDSNNLIQGTPIPQNPGDTLITPSTTGTSGGFTRQSFTVNINSSCSQGDYLDTDCSDQLKLACIDKSEEEIPLVEIPECLYKNIPSKYITQLEVELPQLGARPPPVRNQAPAAGAPAQAPAQAPPPPQVVSVKTYALAQINESSSLQEFNDVSNLRIAGLIYTDTQKPSQTCIKASPTITIYKVLEDTSVSLYPLVYKEEGASAKNCYSHELPPNTIKEFGDYLVKVSFDPGSNQEFKESFAETTFTYKQKPRVNTATTITLEGIGKENGKFVTTIPELEKNGGLAYTACTTTTPPDAGNIASISPSIRIDNLTSLPIILSGGSRQIPNCQQQTVSYNSIAAAVSQQVTDISSISITASFPGDTQNNYQKSSESVRVFIKSESNPISRSVAPLPTALVVTLSHTPAQITPGTKATFYAESNLVVENPKFVLTLVDGQVTTLPETNISRDNNCQQTGGSCIYSVSMTPSSGLSKIAFYNGDNLIQEIVATNAPSTPTVNPPSGQNGLGNQQAGIANGQAPALGDIGGNQGGQAQAPAVVTPPVRNIIAVYLQLPAGEVELLANNGQVDLQVPVGITNMNIKIVYDQPDQYGSNTHVKPFTIIYAPPQVPPAQTSTNCTPREYRRKCVEASQCRYSVEQCRADGSGFDDLGTEDNCKIASEEVPGGCNTKQPEAPPPAPIPEGPSESCWQFDHDECLGCNISRSVEICNGETRVKPGTENGITNNACLTYIQPTHVRNECIYCNHARVINAYCTGQEYVAEEDVYDSGCSDRCLDQPEPGQTCDPNDPNYLAYYCQGDEIAVYKHLNEACEIKFDTVDCKDRGQVCSLGDCVDPQ